jgi:nucleotide-binding universal stress UspA family protein
MIYNTIMVQLDVDNPLAPRLSFAWELARRFEADLVAFAAAEPLIIVSASNSRILAADAMRDHIKEIEERLGALEGEFRRANYDENRVSWRSFVGNPTRFLALHSRAADLVVIGSSPAGSGDHLRTVDPGSLVLSAGRPILIASDSLTLLQAQSVLVAWKDCREARRAVVDALPFLIGAGDVLVAAFEEGDAAASRESAADVVRFLIKHGAKARLEVSGVGHSDVGEAILEMAREMGTDLIVTGGYGHSRLREWVFGGVTRSLLRDGSLNRLISN